MHGHHHHHHHHHSHHQHEDESSSRIGWAFFLNATFTVIEFVGGWLTNSTAIMADAVHDLGDSLSIGSAWLLNKIGRKDPDEQFTYGYRRLSLFGALLNALILMVGSVWILSEAIPRLWQPEMPHAQGMFYLAILGVVVNGVAAYRLSRGKTLNEKVLNWHLLEDVLGWVAVLVVSVVLMFVELPILDPLLSILFTLFILFNVLRLLWSTLKLFSQSVPDPDLRQEIFDTLDRLRGIADVHHLHLWSLDGENHVLTAHLVLDETVAYKEVTRLKSEISEALTSYRLAHTTIEFEWPDEVCRDTGLESNSREEED